MKNDHIWNEMVRQGADGVDFVPLFWDMKTTKPYESYSKKQWETQGIYPKSSYRFWKFGENGVRYYCDESCV